MNELQIFKNDEFGEVRTLSINNEPMFIGKDVAEKLGYANTRDAIFRHVDDEDKASVEFHDGRQLRNGIAINESGLYSLVLSSKLPSAKKFKRWVTKEVIPSIRKNGGYIANQENSTPEQILANAMLVANKVIEEQKKQLEVKTREVEELKPKAIFADAVEVSNTSILVGQLAKMISQNGVKIGQNRLFAWLRENGYLHSAGNQYNLPTQKSIDLKVMKTKERTVNNPDGSVRATFTPMITGKGQKYFINKFLNK